MTTAPVTVAIIGSGFAGLAAAIELKRAGIDDLMVFEQARDIGGVWRDNSYPGAACDVASALYSFSFEPNPKWSRAFAPQSEIHAYLQHCADKYDVTRHISYNTRITSAAFNDAEGTWQLETAEGQRYAARVLVSACGQLRRPRVPEIPGSEDYSGVVFHSAQWNHDFDPRGKRVAVVGNGASAVQIIPQIAGHVAQLTIFQRSAEYLIPKLDFPLGRWSHRLFVRFPLVLRALRALWWLLNESMIPALTRNMSRRMRTVLLAPLYLAAKAQLRWQVRDPNLRAKLTPDYQLGCKRILLSSNYYPALLLPTTEVIVEAITRFTTAGVTTSDGSTREFDAVVFATGFRTNDFVAPMTVRGLNGEDLTTAWKNGPEAYLGMSVTGFPNFYLMYGPNTNLGGGSIIYMLESQARYIVDAVRKLISTGATYFDLYPEVLAEFNERAQRQLSGSVWVQGGCTSWYKNDSQRVINNWPGHTFDYRRRTRRLDLSNYRVVSFPSTKSGAQSARQVSR